MTSDRRTFLGTMLKSSLLFVYLPNEKLFSMPPTGITIKASKYSVKQTLDKVQEFLQAHGATIYSRIDQQAELAKVDLAIGPIEFMMFGNPRAGGPMMMKEPLVALDLPLKIIAWEDKDKAVWVAYNEAAFIQERFALPADISGPLELGPIIAKALA
jgi:uncharacterized protein (DUF302 family)